MHIPMPPSWFHHHGLELSLGGKPIIQVTHENEVVVDSNVAHLQIRPSITKGVYQVIWHIAFSSNESVQGQICLTHSELKEAFDLSSTNEKSVFAELLNADVGVQGHYIREGKWLNMPAPGNGFDGDPNISVFVTDDLQDAVRKLVES